MTNDATSYSYGGGGTVSGSGGWTKSGPGTLTLGNLTVTRPGGMTIQAGTVNVGDGSSDPFLTADIQNAGTLVFNVTGTQNPNSVISGAGTVSKTGNGTLTLGGNNTYSGATTISAGRVDLGSSGALGTTAAGTTVSSGAELHVTTGLTVAEPLSLSGSGPSGAGAFAVEAGASTWTGPVTLTGDTLMTIPNDVTMAFSGGVNGGGKTLLFSPTTTTAGGAFAVSSTMTNVATLVLSNTLNLGGLFLSAANDSLTNILVHGPVNPGAGALSFNGLWAQHDRALGTNSSVTLINSNQTLNLGARLVLNNNVTIPAGVTLHLYGVGEGDVGVGTYRTSLQSSATTNNAWNGPVTLHGSLTSGSAGLIQFYNQSGSFLINGPVSFAEGTAELILRGAGGTGIINGTVNLGTNNLRRTDTATWVIASTGNTWREAYWNFGTFRLGAHDAFCTTAPVRLDFVANAAGNPAPFLDLNGFNQRLGGLYTGGSGSAFVPAVVNSSTNTESTLTVSSSIGTNWVYAGLLSAVLGGRPLHLEVAGTDPLILTAHANTYTGGTVIRSNATLALQDPGYITDSTPIDVQAGGTFDVSQSVSGGYSMSGGQTLMGGGTINGSLWTFPGSVLSPGASIGGLTITNNLIVKGDLWFEVNKSLSPAASNDVIMVGGVITNTGTGTLTVSNLNLGAPLAAGDQFTLFNQAVGSGSALTIAPPPGPGLAWTNLLSLNGSIAVVQSVATNPTNIQYSVTGNQLTLSWPQDHIGWTLEAQTNSLSTGLTNNWVPVSGSTTVNTMDFPISTANGAVFFRLVYP